MIPYAGRARHDRRMDKAGRRLIHKTARRTNKKENAVLAVMRNG